MKWFWIPLSILLLITGITVVSVIYTTPNPKYIDKAPLGAVGSGLHLEDTNRTICLEVSREVSVDWPIHNAVYNWNRNGSNLFTTEFDKKCDGIVLITQTDTKLWYGNTEFYPRDVINVQFSISAPTNRHPAVVCHELGHVLGLVHSDGDGSCMDPNHNNPEPTTKDLAAVATEPWSAHVAANKIRGVK